jgi:hypothetical protein
VTTTLYPVSYKYINISIPVPLTESINAPVLPYFVKGYIKTEENWTTLPESS